MKKIVRYLIIIPLAIVIIALAVGNRHFVTVNLDPFQLLNPPLSMQLPLFILILVGILIGVIAGGAAAWVKQGKWRRAARNSSSEAELWRTEADRLRRGQNEQGAPALPSPDA